MTVFANKLEVSCQAQANKVIAAFPDVCMTPPENPATPPGVPVPYPNFGLDGDTKKGTSTVKIKNKTVNQKNNSHFSKTTGNEAGCAAKKGVISSKNRGKAYSQMWSMNVKMQGKPATRFSDGETNNHGSLVGNAPFWPKIGSPHYKDGKDPCAGDKKKIEDNCGDKTLDEACAEAGLDKSVSELYEHTGSTHYYTGDYGDSPTPIGSSTGTPEGQFRDSATAQRHWDDAQESPCLAALKCALSPYDPKTCCPGQTPHHLVFKSCFPKNNGHDLEAVRKGSYNENAAPCICAEGPSHNKGSHGAHHTEMKAVIVDATGPVGGTIKGKKLKFNNGSTTSSKVRSMKYKDFRDQAVQKVQVVFPMSFCDPACMKAQLDDYHCDQLGVKPNDDIAATINAGFGDDPREVALQYNQSRLRAQGRGLDGMVQTCPFTGAPM